MKKTIFVLSMLIIGFLGSAQNSLVVKFLPRENYPWTILYRIQDVKQTYIQNKQLGKEQSEFIYDLSKQNTGEYLLMYDTNPKNFIYFIYTGTSVHMKVFPKENNRVEFIDSKENEILYAYRKQRDSLVDLLNKTESKLARDQKLTETEIAQFNRNRKELKNIQKKFRKRSKKLFAYKLIINLSEYYPEFQTDKSKYFNDKMQHYLDDTNWDDVDLMNTNVLIGKINHYVFNINPPADFRKKHKEYIQRVEKVLTKIKNDNYRYNTILSLISSFAQTEGKTAKYLVEKYYHNMPEKYKTQINLKTLEHEIGFTVGEKVPDFNFKDLKKKHHLYEINKKPYTLLIFWGATCSHCLKEMPKFQKIMKAHLKNFDVVAIGLETEDYPWSSEHQYYPEFYHGLKLQKWDNPIVKQYHLKWTPTLFVLDKNHKIIAKPYDSEALKNVLKIIDKK